MYLPLIFSLGVGALLALQHRVLRDWEDKNRGFNNREARHKRRSDRVDARWAAEKKEYLERRAQKKQAKAKAREREAELEERRARGEVPRGERQRRWVYGVE